MEYNLIFELTKEFKKELFNGLADWIIYKEPNYPSFGDFKFWIKNQNHQYVIYKNYEKEILMLLKFLPIRRHMNNVSYALILDQILI